MTPDVIDVKTQPNFELVVTFADGARKLFSMLPYLQYPAFCPLSEPGKFAQDYPDSATERVERLHAVARTGRQMPLIGPATNVSCARDTRNARKTHQRSTRYHLRLFLPSSLHHASCRQRMRLLLRSALLGPAKAHKTGR